MNWRKFRDMIIFNIFCKGIKLFIPRFFWINISSVIEILY